MPNLPGGVNLIKNGDVAGKIAVLCASISGNELVDIDRQYSCCCWFCLLYSQYSYASNKQQCGNTLQYVDVNAYFEVDDDHCCEQTPTPTYYDVDVDVDGYGYGLESASARTGINQMMHID